MAELGPSAPTAPADSPPQGLPVASAPEPAETPPAQPTSTGTPDEGDTSGGPETKPEGDTEPKPPAWAEAADLDALLGVEDVAKAIEERETAASERGRSETHSRMQPLLQRQEELLMGIDKTATKFVNDWNKLVKSGSFTKEQIGELLEENQEAFQSLAGVHQDVGMWSGITQVMQRVGTQLGDTAFVNDYAGRIDKMRRGLQDPTFLEDFVRDVSKAVATPIRDQLKEANATIVRLEQEAKTAQRDGTQPPPKVAGRTGGGGGADPNAVLRDPSATPDQKKEALRQKHGIDPDAI